ncbi:MAG: sulfotransferase domain-containing protein [Caldilineaceae bacterium]
MLVDFMMIGAQKCGTTSLAAQLAQHPEICFCSIKEPGFFHQHADWQEQLSDYHALYLPGAGQICGEASTMYTFLPEWQETPQRLFEYNPNLKLIYIMRDPVARVLSNYTHDLVRSIVKEAPEIAIFKDPVYINRSRYAVQMRPYLELFDRNQILFLIFEDYVTNQACTLQKVAEFLGISVDPFGTVEKVHAASICWSISAAK